MTQTAPSVEVLLISMPFGPLRLPSLGLSLLQSSLKDTRARVLYLNLAFAEQIEPSFYDALAHGYPHGPSLLGEWLFARALSGTEVHSASAYLDTLVKPWVGVKEWPELRKRLLETRQKALDFIDRCVRQIEQCHPRIVGFTSVFQQQVASLALARRLKQVKPETFILFGGANCESVMGWELVRQFPFIDAVVSGEAETVFPPLVARVMKGAAVSDMEGVYTRDKPGSVDAQHTRNAPRAARLDELPYPDYGDFFEQWNASTVRNVFQPGLLFETSRGCWWGEKHHCTFCGLNGLGMAYRSKSPERALAELTHLTTRHPGSSILVVDNILDLGYFRSFLPELAKAKLGVKLFYEVKANLKKDQIRLLRDAGIDEIQPGIESFSDSVLQLMRKGVSGLQNIQLLKWCAELGVWPSWHFIWGFPGEQPREYKRMAELVPLLTHLPPPSAAIPIRLDRFSPNFVQGETLGFRKIRPLAAYRFIYPLPSRALFNVAYHFDYDDEDGRDVGRYTQALVRTLQQWKEEYNHAELFHIEKGEELWIWDFRQVAQKPLTVLNGLDKALYLACDAVRRLDRLVPLASAAMGTHATADDVEEALLPLLDLGLMVRQDDRVLSLAVRRGQAPQTV